MVCERCGCKHEGEFGTGRFCSQLCANRRGTNKKSLICTYCSIGFESYINKKYCSSDCYLKDPNKKMGGYREGSGRAKTGYYKGIYCGSTYELVWVIYQLDHSVQFERFEGVIEGDGIRYIPDFLIGNTIFEMKGYESDETVERKTNLAQTKGYDVVVLRKPDLKKEFEWVESNYTYRNVCELYDDYKPKYTYECSKCGNEFYRERKVKTNVKFCSRRCTGLASIGRNKSGFNGHKKNPNKA